MTSDIETTVEFLLPGDIILSGWYELSRAETCEVVAVEPHSEYTMWVIISDQYGHLTPVIQDNDTYIAVRREMGTPHGEGDPVF